MRSLTKALFGFQLFSGAFLFALLFSSTYGIRQIFIGGAVVLLLETIYFVVLVTHVITLDTLLSLVEAADAMQSRRQGGSSPEAPLELLTMDQYGDRFRVRKPANFAVLLVWYWCFAPFLGWGIARFLPP